MTLDLNQTPFPAVFNCQTSGAWEFTYDDSGDYLYFTSQGMNFYHLPSLQSYGGYAWEGFTVSNSRDNNLSYSNDADYQFNCMAQGGVDSVGAPFLLGYYSEYYAGMSNESPLQIIFDTVVTPISFYACNTVWAYKSVIEDGQFSNAFAAGDSLTVVIRGLDEDYEVIPGNEVHFDLADYRSENSADWSVNTQWELVNLASLGKVSGLTIRIFTTDKDPSMGFANTPLYIAMDKVKYHRERELDTTSFEPLEMDCQVYPNPFVDYIRINLNNSSAYTIYNQVGQVVVSGQLQTGENIIETSHLSNGILTSC